MLNSCKRNQYLNDATEELVEENFQYYDLADIENTINQTKIYNLIKNGGNINKFNLNVYAYVYNELLIFPSSNLDYETITTKKSFLHTHQLIKGKTHLHHSHVTSEIIGYTHDFCNQRVIEKQNTDIPFIAHNFFGFDIFYFLKTFVAAAWCTKDVNIGGNHLTHINYGNFQNKVKLIDSLRFYQKILAEMSSTMTDGEKKAVKNITVKFLNSHYYFSTIWPFRPPHKKDKILDIIAEGKGVDMESFFIKPEGIFWEKSEFFSELKQKAVNNESYENSKYLYTIFTMLKMLFY